MKLSCAKITNFRRLKSTTISFDSEVSIFVGANNSGKTSATQLFQLFLSENRGERFSVFDFSADLISALEKHEGHDIATLPTITMDLWFELVKADLHRITDILPSIKWNKSLLGVRLEYKPKNEDDLLKRYRDFKDKAKALVEKHEEKHFLPWPKNLKDYLSKNLHVEYGIHYYVLDRADFDAKFEAIDPSHQPDVLGDDNERHPTRILKSLLKVDFLNAQRHLSDNESSGRSEDLSKRLSRFYERNLKKKDQDLKALVALDAAETQMSEHLSIVFGPSIKSLNLVGYPGQKNPELIIKAAFLPEAVMKQGAKVHYAIQNEEGASLRIDLPDSYNGLGFKNLIYMAVELLDFHSSWISEEPQNRSLLHLIFIEEPEAHLHAQLQQVFIKKVHQMIAEATPDGEKSNHQLVVTTHSPHMIYERGFKAIKYFRRESAQVSSVLSLSNFVDKTYSDPGFLERYMKLTHCDLFFADGVILVEGNVERLLLPLMVEKSCPNLQPKYITILEVGGAYAFRFKEIIEFLGIDALVITDIDSVLPKSQSGKKETDEIRHDKDDVAREESADLVADSDEQEGSDGNDDDDNEEEVEGKACPTTCAGAVTTNQTLIQWLPKKTKISEILNSSEKDLIQVPTKESKSHIRVAFQQEVSFGTPEDNIKVAGRTLEEAFCIENFEWCQSIDRKHLQLRIRGIEKLKSAEIVEKIFRKVKSSNFNKTNFAMSLIDQKSTDWVVPSYIAVGLNWLNQRIEGEVGLASDDLKGAQ